MESASGSFAEKPASRTRAQFSDSIDPNLFDILDSNKPKGALNKPRLTDEVMISCGFEVPKDVHPPRVDAEAVLTSFLNHSQKMNRSVRPAAAGEKLHAHLESLYTAARWEAPTMALDSAEFRELVLQKLREVNRKGSPGFPIFYSHSTNADYLRDKEALLDKPATDAYLGGIADLIVHRAKQYARGELVADPIRLFVKHEGHKTKKVEKGLWRLISSVGLFDQVIDAILFDPSLRAEIAQCEHIPSKPGTSFLWGGFNALYCKFNNQSPCVTIDKSAWDWTVPGWLYEVDREARERLCLNWGAVKDNYFGNLWRNRYAQLAQASFFLPNGMIVKQKFPAMVKSGSKITISMNSRSQMVLKLLYLEDKFSVERHGLISMGDDTVERVVDIDIADYMAFISKLGFTVKDVPTAGPLIDNEFCSMRFKKLACGTVVPVPDNWDKHMFELTQVEKLDYDRAEKLQAYCLLYCYHDKFSLFHSALLAECGRLKAAGVAEPYKRFASHAWFKTVVTGQEHSCESNDPPRGGEAREDLNRSVADLLDCWVTTQ